MKNTSKSRFLKWALASALLCALLVCTWAVAADAEETTHTHSYELLCTWAEDEPKVTSAKLKCKNADCGDEVALSSEDFTITKSSWVSSATCTQAAMYYYKASVSYVGESYSRVSSVPYPDGSPKGHRYSVSADDFTLSADKQNATATAACIRCDDTTDGHTTTIMATVTDSRFSSGDCQTPSRWTYTLSFELNGSTYKKTLSVEGDLGDHLYKIAANGFTLSADKKTATATAVCSQCNDTTDGHTTTITANVKDSEEAYAGNCQTPSQWKYTLSYVLNGTTLETYLYVEGDLGDHQYKMTEDGFTLSADKQIATATAVCRLCDDTTNGHTTTITANVTDSKEVRAGTCQTPSNWQYTLSYKLNGSTYTTYLSVEGDLGDHLYAITKDGFTLSEDKKTATVTAVCSRCDDTTTIKATVIDSEKIHSGSCQTPSRWKYTLSYELNGKTLETDLSVDGDYGDEHQYRLFCDWSEDTTAAPSVTSAKLKCNRQGCDNEADICCDDIAFHLHNFVSGSTCTQPEMWYYYATVEYNGKTYNSQFSENAYPYGDPLGHRYHLTSDFVLSEDKKTATATAVCPNCDEATDGHTTTLTANVTGAEKVDPGNCQTPSRWKYTFSYVLDDATIEDSLYHEGNYGDHVFASTPSDRLAHAATCTTPAEYYVKCSLCDAVNETKTVKVGDPLGHLYNTPTDFILSDDKQTATGTASCRRCAAGTDGHSISVKASVIEATELPGNCQTKESTEYTLSVEWEGETITCILGIDGDAYGDHVFASIPSDQLAHAATCTAPAEYYVKCSFCDAVNKTKTVKVGDPLGHNHQLTSEFIFSADGKTATANAVCEHCQEPVTVTANRGSLVDWYDGNCREYAWVQYQYTYTLNDESYAFNGPRSEGYYGDHNFAQSVTLNGKPVSVCSICGELEGMEAQPTLSGELTGTSRLTRAYRVKVRYGTLADGQKAILIVLVDRNGDAVTVHGTHEVSIPLAELNALLGENAATTFTRKLYWNDAQTGELVPVQYSIKNDKLILNVSFETSSLYLLTPEEN